VTQQCVLITGAGGFIGRHLIRHQIERGRRVRALDCNAQRLRNLASTEGLDVIVGDIADRDVQRKAVNGAELVFHLASAHLETGLPYTEYHRINVAAVGALLEESRDAGVRRFVHISTCGVHGTVENPPGDEQAPFRPDIEYERTKLAGELLAHDFYDRYRFPLVVVRPVWVYGPGCKRTARLFCSIAEEKFVMASQGLNLRSAVYITDLLDSLELCATRQGIEGEVFIIAHDPPVTVRDIVDEVARVVGVSRPRRRIPLWLAWWLIASAEVYGRTFRKSPSISRRSLKFFTNDAGFTCEKARRMLGFNPQVDLRTGLELTYQWWHRKGAL
jgi:nucleoside-diphosphate-sugar epimerase